MSPRGLAPIPHGAGLMVPPDVAVRVRGFQPIVTRDYPMPPDKVQFVGEPVAIVVAETIDRAKDAAELLDIAYDPLPAVVRAADAVKPGAPRLWEDAPDNLSIDIEVGDEAATAAAFQRAAHIIRLDTWVQRVTGVPMEPRTTTAEYDATMGHYSGSGRGVAKLRLDLPKSSVCQPSRSAACARTWAEISARGTFSIPNTPFSLGRRAGSGGR